MRRFDLFTKNNSSFLVKAFPLPQLALETDETSPDVPTTSKKPRVGRKPLPFEGKSLRAQQYASARVRDLHEPGAIVLAASQQSTTLGRLVKKTKSPSGQTAGLALKAINHNTIISR